MLVLKVNGEKKMSDNLPARSPIIPECRHYSSKPIEPQSSAVTEALEQFLLFIYV